MRLGNNFLAIIPPVFAEVKPLSSKESGFRKNIETQTAQKATPVLKATGKLAIS
jgi:hypothetical protein